MHDTEHESALLTRGECDELFQRVVRVVGGRTQFTIAIESVRRGNIRWAGNDVISTGETADHQLSINAYWYSTNQFDEASLSTAINAVIRKRHIKALPRQYSINTPNPQIGPQQYLAPPLFYEHTAAMGAGMRSDIGRTLTAPVKASGLLAAGYLAVDATTNAVYNTSGLAAYIRSTTAQYSVTVRDTQGTSSGWAGVDQNDWSRIDAAAITERAKQKCLASATPRSIEPGRYLAILEPQAVHQLMSAAVGAMNRATAEVGGPYHYRGDESKLGQRIMDPRINLRSDPMDPMCNTLPFTPNGFDPGIPIQPSTWVTNGILTQLPYGTNYAVSLLDDPAGRPEPLGYHMTGGPTTVDEMITTTTRGVLVTRFSHMEAIDPASILMGGVTRDGLWLIEHGKITHAIKNFRFMESPLFIFNQVEQLGEPVRVFSPGFPAVVPPVKVRDFNFTALIDAV